MFQLLYHQMNQDISPFDEALVRVFSEESVSIACPYISIRYLQRLLSLTSNWRLLTDLAELYSSTPKSDRDLLRNFLNRHMARVKTLDGLHAKVAIGNNSAMFGSANLTISGVTKRLELSALTTGNDEVAELARWFQNAWVSAIPVSESLIIQSSELPFTPAVTKFVDLEQHSLTDISSMALRTEFPAQPELDAPLIRLLSESGGTMTLRQIYTQLAKKMRLAPQLLEEQVSTARKGDMTRTEPKWENWVRQVGRRLVAEGRIERGGRGIYRLTRES